MAGQGGRRALTPLEKRLFIKAKSREKSMLSKKPEVRPGNASRADYPRMLYKPDGTTMIAKDAHQHDAAMKDGWDTVPPAAFNRPKPTTTPVASGGEPLAMLIREVMEAVLDERGIHKVTDKGEGHGERTESKQARR